MIALLLPLMLCATPSGPVIDPRVEQFFGRQVAAVLARPAEIEVFRIVSHDEEPKQAAQEGTRTRIGGFLVTSVGNTVKGDEAVRAGELTLSPLHYEFPPPCPPGLACGSVKLCGGFHPGVALRFWSAAQHAKAQKVDVFLCFHCDDLGVFRRVKDHGKGTDYVAESDMDSADPNEIDTLDIGPGRTAFLELVAGFLPDDPDLKRLLAADFERKYNDARFEAELTPALRAAVARRVNGMVAPGADRPSPIKVAGPPVETLIAVARAVAVHDTDYWSGRDGTGTALVAVVEGFSTEELLAAFAAARRDRQAMIGLARLFFFEDQWRRIPKESRGNIGVALAEVALAEAPGGDKPRLVESLSDSPNPDALALLRRVVQQQFAMNHLDSWPSAEPDISLVTLIRLARRQEQAEFIRKVVPGLHGATEVDRAGIEVAAALGGDGDRLKPEFFSSTSEYVALGAIDAVDVSNGAVGMDALVDRGLRHQFWRVREKARRVFLQLTAPEFTLPPDISDERHDTQATRVIQEWWRDHRGEFLARHAAPKK